ncbi:MurR/RpiR family transcriptional regulator [Alkalicoccobacillus plakortidis]|uniref:MurR/RpiR family transcriptional regulator n=1 Tax=Alkalicoccobacillus plakortidis TaxID=444060 RepID=A0ABT0XK88_9BACI|nr:MurR/RpiR family transcriptional regulator [Alkalicoccobacillus plakortidis]MCM2676120.1 MurR/RpiR family transcriptional regulator [Alkalicoccobacillus plakortidis]
MVPFDAYTLTKSQQMIADYISKNNHLVPYLTELDIARACSVSIATVSRFWSAVGHQNLKSFKHSFKDYDGTITPAKKMESAVEKYEHTYLNHMFQSSIGFIEETLKHLSMHNFEQSVETISQSATIHIYSSGPANGLASLLQFRLRRFNVQVTTLAQSGHEIYEDLIHIGSKDTIVLFGFVHFSPEIQVLLDYASKRMIKTILLTDLLVSPMVNQATYVLYTERGEMGEFHSMVAPTALIESLVVAVGKNIGPSALDKLHELHTLRKTYSNKLPKK